MKCTELMVTFEKQALKLVEVEGERYMTTKDLALALNAKIRSVKKLVKEMRDRGELKEGVHLRCLRVPTSGGPQTTILMTYRGVIRVAMRSDSQRAIRFRDWAEEVLYGVMTSAGGDATALRSFVENGLKEIGSANDQATKKACELILSLRAGEPTVLPTAPRPITKTRGYLTAVQWVKKYYPRYSFPSMNSGGKFEGYTAKRFFTERGRWPEHDGTTRLYAWIYSDRSDREFLERCLVEFLKDQAPLSIIPGNDATQKAITAGGA